MLRVILVVTIIAVSLFLMGCSDSTVAPLDDGGTTVTVAADVLADAMTSSGDASEGVATEDAVSEDVAYEGDTAEAVDISSSQVEADVPESLPADPTENPEGSESAYYEFSEWAVPPSNDDNR